MKELINLPLCTSMLQDFTSSQELDSCLGRMGCDGLEVVWAGEDCDTSVVSPDRVWGYHLTFFNDWLDFWRGDKAALLRKFGDEDTVRSIYGGLEPEVLLQRYEQDLKRAVAWGAKYVVFHVSDVSMEEGYTYQWEHSDEEVIDAAAEIINLLLDGKGFTFDFLMENLSWPGFRFTEPTLTARMLNGVHYQNKGIMLDIGHLMCTEPSLENECQGVDFLHKTLDVHGELCQSIKGIHLHQSLSGEYVRTHTGFMPQLQGDYLERYSQSYGHILQIDTHRPWTDPGIVTVLKRVRPAYLVHELAAANLEDKMGVTAIQINTVRRGMGGQGTANTVRI